MALEHAGEDELADRAGHGGEHAAEAGHRLGVGLGLLAAVERALARLGGPLRRGALRLALPAGEEVDVDADGQARLRGRGPERLVVVGEAVAARRPVRDHDTLEAARRRLQEVVDGDIDADRRDLRHARRGARGRARRTARTGSCCRRRRRRARSRRPRRRGSGRSCAAARRAPRRRRRRGPCPSGARRRRSNRRAPPRR